MPDTFYHIVLYRSIPFGGWEWGGLNRMGIHMVGMANWIDRQTDEWKSVCLSVKHICRYGSICFVLLFCGMSRIGKIGRSSMI